MRLARRICLLALALTAALLLAPAQVRAQAPALGVEIASLDHDQADTVRAVVTVLDPTGRPVPGLMPESFRATLNGEPRAVRDVQVSLNAAFGIDVLLVVDTSGSMEGQPLAEAKAAARAFVEGLAPQDRAAVLTFNDDATLVQDFSADKALVIAALDGLAAAGETVLYQATADSARLAATSASSRKAIILLSDGLNHGSTSQLSREDSLAAARTLGVPTFAIGLGDQIDRTYLVELTQATGGRFLEAPAPQVLAQLYQDIANLLRSQYVVTLDATGIVLTQPIAVRLDVVAGELAGSAERTMEAPVVPGGPPTVTLSGLTAGQEVSGSTTVSAEVTSKDPLAVVTFLVNDGTTYINVHQAEEPPFEYVLDPDTFAEGGYTLRVEAVTVFGETGAAESTFSVAASGGGGLTAIPLLLLVVVLLAAGGAWFYLLLRRRRQAAVTRSDVDPWPRRPTPTGPISVDWDRRSPPAERLEEEPQGRLVATAGPLAGQEFPVGTRPLSIGSGYRSAIVLDSEEGRIASEEARVWVRNGRLMVHRLAHVTATVTEDAGGGWAILDPGETFRIDHHEFCFELPRERDEEPRDSDGEAPSVETPSVLRDGSSLRTAAEPPAED